MEIIDQNPYRVAGIYGNSKEKELQKNKSKINAYAKVGKEVSFDVDFPFLQSISRKEETLEKSFAALQQYKDRVYYGLFWFINLTSIDSTALNYLRNGDKQKAMEIWSKVVDGKPINSKNFSAYNNQSTLLLKGESLSEIKQGINFKVQLIQSDYADEFVHALSDKTFSVDSSTLLNSFVEEILNQLGNNGFNKKDLLSVFNDHNDAVNLAKNKLITSPLNNIETLTESTKAKRKEDKSNGLKLGRALLNKTVKDLNFLEETLGDDNVKYKYAADNLAKEVLQCGIDYFKYWQEENDEKVGKDVLSLFQDAKYIAVGAQANERIDDNIGGLEEWVANQRYLKLIPKKWFTILEELKNIHEDLENKQVEPKYALKKINSFSLNELNQLESFADDIRISIAFAIRGISVSIWNNYHDIETLKYSRSLRPIHDFS
mgnify:CR=1 FL=1